MNSPLLNTTASELGYFGCSALEGLSPRKRAFFNSAEKFACRREEWIAKNEAYYADNIRYMRFLIPEGARVLDIGSGTGRLLTSLNPSEGVGIDFSPAMIKEARRLHPHIHFVLGDIENPATITQIDGVFDYIILSDMVGVFDDIEQALRQLHRFCTARTRIVLTHCSSYWSPVLHLATKLGRRMPQPPHSRISSTDFLNILNLADFEPIRMEFRQLVPVKLFGLGRFVNRFIAPLPLVRNLCLRAYVVVRSRRVRPIGGLSTTIVIPCRNECGNVARAIKEMPRFGGHQEIIFVEGNSQDGTYDECLRLQKVYNTEWDIKVLKQDGRGKGDAVSKGFANASGDILMILDADLTVPPTALPQFYDAIASGKGEFVNGTRLVYPTENAAMRFLNHIANRLFAFVFSYLLNQRFTDTLCGTKALRRTDYQRVVRSRAYFGNFDPFGDFDLIFGAAKHNLRIIEIPVRYQARTFGETQISRFHDGWLLLRMTMLAYLKLKAI
jgi:SAM-dependent methyltransferase